MTFAGFDTSAYPGDAAMGALKATTNLAFTGFYLGPAPSHRDIGWMDKRATLVAMGFGLAPIYVGQQTIGPGSRNVSAAQGTIDGGDAAGLMLEAGFPDLSVCFLDLENGPPFHGAQISYVQMWCAALKLGRYTPGVYCSHAIAEDVRAAVIVLYCALAWLAALAAFVAAWSAFRSYVRSLEPWESEGPWGR